MIPFDSSGGCTLVCFFIWINNTNTGGDGSWLSFVLIGVEVKFAALVVIVFPGNKINK